MDNMVIVGLLVLATIVAQPFLSADTRKQVSPVAAQTPPDDQDEEESDDEAVSMDDDEDNQT